MLTEAQTKTLAFIKRFVAEYGYSPTIAEIAAGIGIKSRSSVHRHLQAIEKTGQVKILPNKRRNIDVANNLLANGQFLPILGKIAAGFPIEAVADNETLDIANLFSGPNRYLLKVVGESMIENNICDGDWVVCEHCSVARSGSIVVALIDNNEATLKRIYYNADKTITLMPSNSQLKPMLYPANRVTVQGILIGLLRIEN